jgi:hypothetical protein
MPQESMKHTKCSFMPKVKHNGKRVTIVTSPLPFVIPKLNVIKPHHLEKLQNNQFILAMTHSMRFYMRICAYYQQSYFPWLATTSWKQV